MKVTGYGSIRPGSGSKKTSGTSSAGSFADILALSGSEETREANGASDISATSALSNLLSLQEISEEDVRRKKLMQQGTNMLDVLDQLRQQLLMGTLPAHLMQDLGRQLEVEKQKTTDPRLNDVMEEIELRLAVELAKLETAKQNQTR